MKKSMSLAEAKKVQKKNAVNKQEELVGDAEGEKQKRKEKTQGIEKELLGNQVPLTKEILEKEFHQDQFANTVFKEGATIEKLEGDIAGKNNGGIFFVKVGGAEYVLKVFPNKNACENAAKVSEQLINEESRQENLPHFAGMLLNPLQIEGNHVGIFEKADGKTLRNLTMELKEDTNGTLNKAYAVLGEKLGNFHYPADEIGRVRTHGDLNPANIFVDINKNFKITLIDNDGANLKDGNLKPEITAPADELGSHFFPQLEKLGLKPEALAGVKDAFMSTYMEKFDSFHKNLESQSQINKLNSMRRYLIDSYKPIANVDEEVKYSKEGQGNYNDLPLNDLRMVGNKNLNILDKEEPILDANATSKNIKATKKGFKNISMSEILNTITPISNNSKNNDVSDQQEQGKDTGKDRDCCCIIY